jgi:hypothetical protein
LGRFEESLADLDHTVKVLQERVAIDQGDFPRVSESKPDKTDEIERAYREMRDEEKSGKLAEK